MYVYIYLPTMHQHWHTYIHTLYFVMMTAFRANLAYISEKRALIIWAEKLRSKTFN